MTNINRRDYMKGLLGLAALSRLPQSARAVQDAPIPAQGIGHRIRHLSYSDIGGRPDSVQIMVNRRHLYVGHMFSNGVTILDAADPRRLKPVGFFTGGDSTRTHHLQVSDDLLLLANGANIVAMQSYDNIRGYFENALADSITNRKKFRSGLSIHDISRPAEMREIAFLEMPGFGVQRLWWTGGRYAYVSAHFDGFTAHDVSDPARPRLLGHINWSPPFPGGTHTPLPLPGRQLAVVADEANAEKCAKGLFQIFVIDVRVPENPVTISTMPVPRDRDYCVAPGTFGPHNLHENRPGSFQSEETIFATYNAGGVRVFDLKNQFAPKELAFWLPPAPAKLIDPRPNVALAAKTADVYVTRDGLIYASDWNAGLHVLEYEG